MTALVHLLLSGNLEHARIWHYRLLPLMDANFLETNPAPVKAALHLMGRIQNVLRLPLAAGERGHLRRAPGRTTPGRSDRCLKSAGKRRSGEARRGKPRLSFGTPGAIERYAGGVPPGEEAEALEAFQALKAELNAGTVRAAERGALMARWRVNVWVEGGNSARLPPGADRAGGGGRSLPLL